MTASYSYDLKGRPLTITYEGVTYWYIFNAHGDVVALTDSTGAVKARYEYDELGRLQAMYDETGRVRAGYGTIGDIGTGPVTPPTGMPTPGNTGKSSKGKDEAGTLTAMVEEPAGELDEASEDLGELQVQGVIGEPADLVKANPYRYAGYRYDRETEYMYLQQRYLDSRLGQFLSQDTLAGDVRTPLSLNRYIYGLNNPVNYIDPDGRSVLLVGMIVLGLLGMGLGACLAYQASDGSLWATVGGGALFFGAMEGVSFLLGKAVSSYAESALHRWVKPSSRAWARSMGKANDDAGHLIGRLLGGPGGRAVR